MSQGQSRILNSLGAAAVILVAVAILYVLVSRERAPQLDRSALGFDGLAELLDDQGRTARTFSGGFQLGTEGLGLRILPLYDDGETLALPVVFREGEETYLLPPARSVPNWVIQDKVEAVPTLIIMPKWSDGVRLSGLAHPDFLLANPERAEIGDTAVPEDGEVGIEGGAQSGEASTPSDETVDGVDDAHAPDPAQGSQDLAFEEGFEPFIRPAVALTSADTQQVQILPATRFGDIELRAPQFLSVPEHCRPLIGDAVSALLIACDAGPDTDPYWVLSDPDLLNNHGLHQGQNAAAALALIDTLSAGQEVVIDYSTFVWTEPDDDRRTIAELLRYFSPPFAWIWIAAGLLFALAWWRGAVRDRPVRSIFGHGHRGARSTVVLAQSRLMRNTGRDGALLRVLAHQRLLSLCDLLLGRDERASNRKARMLAFVERRNPDLARRLTEVLAETETMPERLTPGAAVAVLTRLETAYEEARQLA